MTERTTNTPLIEAGNVVIHNSEQIQAFLDDQFTLTPKAAVQDLIAEADKVSAMILETENPQTVDQVYNNEIKRRMAAEAIYYRTRFFTQGTPDWTEIVDSYNIPLEDVLGLESWFLQNMTKIQESNERFRLTGNWVRTVRPSLGVPASREQAEYLLTQQIDAFRNVLGAYFLDWPGVPGVLKNWTIGPDSWTDRSYCGDTSRVVGISTRQTMSVQNGSMRLIEDEFIKLFGHEVIGHARHFEVVQDETQLPQFVRTYTGFAIEATEESIAQYFQARIFEYLRSNPDVYAMLGLKEPFEKVYQRYKDRELLSEYWKNLSRLGILKLAQNGKDHLQVTADAMAPFVPDDGWLSGFFNRHRDSWDQLNGKLLSRVVSELRYCANPVKRIIERVPKNQKEEAEKLILHGYWTPIGLEQWVDVNLKKPQKA